MDTSILVVVSAEGLFWSGREWTANQAHAKPFRGIRKAFTCAHDVAQALRARGDRCSVGVLLGRKRK